MQSDMSMSASPADRTPGETPGRTPNGAPLKIIRRHRKAADPLVRRKDPKKKPPPDQTPKANGMSSQQLNGLHPASYRPSLQQQQPARPQPPLSRAFLPSSENAVSGFSSPPVAPFQDFPLILSKRAIIEGFRHHVARFASKRDVDPRNSEEFVRPVRLHRKDPHRTNKNEGEGDKSGNDKDSKEAAAKELADAEKKARKDAENAKVAPSSKTQQNRGLKFKLTEQIYRSDLTEEQKARAKLRYEEALPWHLEDFDGKSTWVGNYEEALSNTYGMLVQGSDKAFRMIPLEKWYKFNEKAKFTILNADEADEMMKKKVKEPRWFMDSQKAQEVRDQQAQEKRLASGLFVGKWEKGGGGSGEAKPVVKQEGADADDLDFVEDRFADDEENMLFEEDDETKEAQDRIKKEQLQANVFDLKEEKEYDKQEELEKKEREAEKKLGKKVKKALKKREKNYIYDSDSAENPYSSQSDSENDSTETEKRKAAEKEKEKEKGSEKDTAKSSPEKVDKPKPKPPKSSSGRATPSSRPSKHPIPAAPISRVASSSNLKRSGSPLASDASGNESTRSRKKAKKNKTANTLAPSSQPTTKPPSRPGSPPIPPSSAPTGGTKRRAGSGSDSDKVSGGEMSDGAKARKRQKLKLRMGSPNGSPNGSRAGSPVVEPAAAASSAPSPPQAANAPSPSPKSDLPFPTAAEVRARIPAEGIGIQDLLKHFPGRVVGKEMFTAFQMLLKSNSKFHKGRKVLLPLE